MILKMLHRITISRLNKDDWFSGTEEVIYENIKADVQYYENNYFSWQNSKYSDQSEYHVFITKEHNNIITWDVISYTKINGNNIKLSVNNIKPIDYYANTNYIEVVCYKIT